MNLLKTKIWSRNEEQSTVNQQKMENVKYLGPALRLGREKSQRNDGQKDEYVWRPRLTKRSVGGPSKRWTDDNQFVRLWVETGWRDHKTETIGRVWRNDYYDDDDDLTITLFHAIVLTDIKYGDTFKRSNIFSPRNRSFTTRLSHLKPGLSGVCRIYLKFLKRNIFDIYYSNIYTL